jgi:outer membrane protein
MKQVTLMILAVYVCSLLPFYAAAAAQEVKLGYVDTVKIFAEFKETVEAEEIYKKEVDVWKKKAEEMQTELAQLREEIQSQSLMLSEEKLAEMKLSFEQQAKEYQQYMDEVFGEGGEAERRNKELTAPIVEKINGVIAKIAEDEGYTIIFDAAQANIVYAKKALDLTDQVLELLAQEFEANE